MAEIKITPQLLDRLRGLARNCQEPIWEVNVHGNVVSASDEVAICGFLEDADFIAAADPATVLAMVEEIERLRVIETYYINGEIKQLESEAGHGK